MYPVVIIGAGIAGLAAAWELKNLGLQALVVERSDRAGGVIISVEVDGFVMDGGPTRSSCKNLLPSTSVAN